MKSLSLSTCVVKVRFLLAENRSSSIVDFFYYRSCFKMSDSSFQKVHTYKCPQFPSFEELTSLLCTLARYTSKNFQAVYFFTATSSIAIPMITRNVPRIKMRFLFLFLLAVSAGALPQSVARSEALKPTILNPNNSTMPNGLFKRDGNTAWVGGFKDPNCQGTHIGEGTHRPKVYAGTGDCYAFELSDGADYVSVYWGTLGGNVRHLSFYSDTGCTALMVNVTNSHSGNMQAGWFCFPKTNFTSPVAAVQEYFE